MQSNQVHGEDGDVEPVIQLKIHTWNQNGHETKAWIQKQKRNANLGTNAPFLVCKQNFEKITKLSIQDEYIPKKVACHTLTKAPTAHDGLKTKSKETAPTPSCRHLQPRALQWDVDPGHWFTQSSSNDIHILDRFVSSPVTIFLPLLGFLLFLDCCFSFESVCSQIARIMLF